MSLAALVLHPLLPLLLLAFVSLLSLLRPMAVAEGIGVCAAKSLVAAQTGLHHQAMAGGVPPWP